MEDYFEDAPHCSRDYYPNYNLFQSSVFYDTDNFRGAYLSMRYDDCGALEDDERSPEPLDQSEEGAPDPSVEGKRVISKADLYKAPDLFQSKLEDLEDIPPPTRSEPPFLSASQPWGYDWTQQSWVKGGGKVVVMNKKKQDLKIKRKGKQSLYNQLVNAPKISISKAESMMQKMGWQGGALGKGANGILEPITPDPIYCSSTIGFGNRTNNNKKPKITKPMRTVTKKGTFRTNLLLYILDFVRDDTEIELIFDAGLNRSERRKIHMTMDELVNGGNAMTLSQAQQDAADGISQHSQYVLRTLSKGEEPNRQLTIYKEAPENVYLVTPDDFLPEDEEIDEQTNNDPIPDEQNADAVKNDLCDTTVKEKETLDTVTMELEDDENPFLKSIKKSIKKDDEPITNKFEKDCNIAKDETIDLTDDSPKCKLLEFFVEFADSEVYNEFRFLGKFTEEQTSVINEFLNDIDACIDNLDSFKGNEEMIKVFKRGDARYEMQDGCNGTVEIHKLPIQGANRNKSIIVD